MSQSVVITQQVYSLDLDKVAPEAKIKDLKGGETAHKGRENYMNKFIEKFSRNNEMVKMTFKGFIDNFHEDLNDPAEATVHIMRKEYNIEINISIGMI